jgi:hypothetical protein
MIIIEDPFIVQKIEAYVVGHFARVHYRSRMHLALRRAILWRLGGKEKVNPNYDEQLLRDFASQFLGYGSLESKLWLIGPEAGGGNDIEEVYDRAQVWARRDRKEIENLHSYHADLTPKVDWTQKIQRTWGPLIRIILARKDGRIASKDAVIEFQRCELGRAGGENCVLDLSPLPSRSESHWILDKFGFDWLRARPQYEEAVVAPRCALLREKLRCYKPRLVIFYGLGHKAKWEHISEEEFSPFRVEHLSTAPADNTLFAMIPHPANLGRILRGKGSVNRFLADVGTVLPETYDGREQSY